MSAKLAYELVAKAGEYTDTMGQRKAKWQKIGAMWMGSDGGYFLTLDPWINLAGFPLTDRGSVMVSCFEPKGRDGALGGGGRPVPAPTLRPSSPKPLPGSFEDDIPF